jgi:thioredoxin 2
MTEIVTCPGCGARNRVRSGMRGVPVCGQCKKPLPVPPAAAIRVLSADNFESAIRLNPKPVLVDFWAPWCQPCRQMAEVLNKFAVAHPGITLAKVDTDAEPSLASQHQIFGIPTLILFVGGREVHRVSGARGETELAAEFQPWLQKAGGG